MSHETLLWEETSGCFCHVDNLTFKKNKEQLTFEILFSGSRRLTTDKTTKVGIKKAEVFLKIM